MTSTDQDLLTTCVQDLHAGCTAFAERFPPLIRMIARTDLRDNFHELVAHAAERQQRLERMKEAPEGPANLWMAGMIDDAERDSRTIMPGRLLDIALIGAVRKALVAELVSHETAILLADELEQSDLLVNLVENRDQLRCLDDTLSELLKELVG